MGNSLTLKRELEETNLLFDKLAHVYLNCNNQSVHLCTNSSVLQTEFDNVKRELSISQKRYYDKLFELTVDSLTRETSKSEELKQTFNILDSKIALLLNEETNDTNRVFRVFKHEVDKLVEKIELTKQKEQEFALQVTELRTELEVCQKMYDECNASHISLQSSYNEKFDELVQINLTYEKTFIAHERLRQENTETLALLNKLNNELDIQTSAKHNIQNEYVSLKQSYEKLDFEYNNVINNDLFGLVDNFNRFLDNYPSYRHQLTINKASIETDFLTFNQRNVFAASLSRLFSFILFDFEDVVTRSSGLDKYLTVNDPKEFVEAVCYFSLSFSNGIYKNGNI